MTMDHLLHDDDIGSFGLPTPSSSTRPRHRPPPSHASTREIRRKRPRALMAGIGGSDGLAVPVAVARTSLDRGGVTGGSRHPLSRINRFPTPPTTSSTDREDDMGHRRGRGRRVSPPNEYRAVDGRMRDDDDDDDDDDHCDGGIDEKEEDEGDRGVVAMAEEGTSGGFRTIVDGTTGGSRKRKKKQLGLGAFLRAKTTTEESHAHDMRAAGRGISDAAAKCDRGGVARSGCEGRHDVVDDVPSLAVVAAARSGDCGGGGGKNDVVDDDDDDDDVENSSVELDGDEDGRSDHPRGYDEDGSDVTQFGIRGCSLRGCHRISHTQGRPPPLPDTDELGRRRRRRSPYSHETRLLRGECGVNVLGLLLQRSCLASPHRRYSSTSSSVSNLLARFVDRGLHWNISRTVGLSSSSSDHGDVENGIIAKGEIRAMSFDRQGVLLATGDDRGHVRLYDFDDVRCADARERNASSRSSMSHWRRLTMRDARSYRGGGRWGGDTVDGEDGYDGAGSSGERVDDVTIDTPGGGRHEVEDHENLEDDGPGNEGGIERSPSIATPAALVRPVLSSTCGAQSGALRIGGVLWNPKNQDHLVVSFT